MRRAGPVFPNAELIMHEVEAAFWLDRAPQPNDPERIARNTKAQRAVTAPYRDRIRRIKDGEVLPGITAMLRPGPHAGAHQLADPVRRRAPADLGRHRASGVGADGAARRHADLRRRSGSGRATRQQVLEWVASERLTVAGAHVGFPGFGRVTRSGDRFAVRRLSSLCHSGAHRRREPQIILRSAASAAQGLWIPASLRSAGMTVRG